MRGTHLLFDSDEVAVWVIRDNALRSLQRLPINLRMVELCSVKHLRGARWLFDASTLRISVWGCLNIIREVIHNISLLLLAMYELSVCSQNTMICIQEPISIKPPAVCSSLLHFYRLFHLAKLTWKQINRANLILIICCVNHIVWALRGTASASIYCYKSICEGFEGLESLYFVNTKISYDRLAIK